METIFDTSFLAKQLLNDQNFIQQLQCKLSPKSSFELKQTLSTDSLIYEIVNLIYQLISKRIQNEIKPLLDQNNKFLAQFRQAFQHQYMLQKQNSILQSSFSQVRRQIDHQKMHIDDLDSSINFNSSILLDGRADSAEQILRCVRTNIKTIQQKFDSGLKSVWNVVCLTENTLFDHIKNCSMTKKKSVQPQPLTEQPSMAKYLPTSLKNLFK